MKLRRLKVIILFAIFTFSQVNAGDFYILFTANLNGVLENCGCGTDPLGGMARITNYINEFKAEHSNTIAIDGGDFLNTYSYPALNSVMAKIMADAQYDFINTGDQEFVEGMEFYKNILTALHNKVLPFIKSDSQPKAVSTGKFTVKMHSFLSSSSFEFIQEPDDLKIMEKDNYQKSAGKNIFDIVVFHGTVEAVKKWIAQHQKPDLILLGHTQSDEDINFNGVRIVGGGRDSEIVKIIKVSERKGKVRIESRSKAMNEHVGYDKNVVQLITESKNNESSN